MIKPVWAAVAGVALLGTTGVVGVVIVASSGGEEEVVQQVETATPTAIGTPTTTASPAATVTAGASPVPDTPAPASSEDYTQAALPGGYEISYPASWNQVLLSDNPYLAKFFLTESEKAGEEELGELVVYVYENPQQLPLEEFFNGQERPNLFEDAAGGYRPFSAGGATGYWFDDVLGFSNSTDVALSSEGYIYEFADPDQRHQDDGVFLQIVLSFNRVEG